ncbi:hypothetical protein NW768_005041 [Fusarium equiseti]|uniref:Major facilitator superfamily (MFS) profile domain-containing protein n=1 Tax=Fusarium equiseti TaxID=61235 RepID=A0ABQ8RE82_FUSEQ|nr:hypothetical protein NW768_005041 [Fusarium equiseti]
MSSINETTDHEGHEPTSRTSIHHQRPERQPDVLSTISEEFDAEEEESLVKKLDLFILPIMAIVYFFQYLDKNSISYAAVFGLITDLELKNREFSWAVSMFYVGQLISQYPTAYALSYSHIIRFISMTVVGSGVIEMCIAASISFPFIAGYRFFLGAYQAAVSPAFIILTSKWYRPHEHPMRVATWISMNGISQTIGGLLMFVLGDVDIGIGSWRVMFLVFGGLTVLSGILFIIIIPENTATAWFLNKRERSIATRRLAIDRNKGDPKNFDIGQLREALLSPLSWLYVLMAFCIASTNPITKVTSLNVQGNTKKSIVGAGFFVAYSVGSIVGPQVWGAEDDHQYLAGPIFTVVNWAMLILVLLIYLMMVRRENKIRDREASKELEESRAVGQDVRDQILVGVSEHWELTDGQDKRFRYST